MNSELIQKYVCGSSCWQLKTTLYELPELVIGWDTICNAEKSSAMKIPSIQASIKALEVDRSGVCRNVPHLGCKPTGTYIYTPRVSSSPPTPTLKHAYLPNSFIVNIVNTMDIPQANCECSRWY